MRGPYGKRVEGVGAVTMEGGREGMTFEVSGLVLVMTPQLCMYTPQSLSPSSYHMYNWLRNVIVMESTS